jgi:MFS transporter, FLVCR family, feline leukemia virus subgroup C receptor-related protein
MTGFQPVGYELAAEITFPEPDGPVAGIMTISTHVFGIAITLIISKIQDSFGDFVGNLVSNLTTTFRMGDLILSAAFMFQCFALLLMFGSIAVSLVKPDLKRHYAHTELAEVAKELSETKDVDYFDENAPLKFKIDEVS